MTKPTVGGFTWIKSQRASSVTHLPSRDPTLNQCRHTSRWCLQHVDEFIGVAAKRNPLRKGPTNPSQAHDHRTQRSMNSMPRRFRTATLQQTTDRTWQFSHRAAPPQGRMNCRLSPYFSHFCSFNNVFRFFFFFFFFFFFSFFHFSVFFHICNFSIFPLSHFFIFSFFQFFIHFSIFSNLLIFCRFFRVF